MDSYNISHCINVLNYWHKVEFFQSFDLQEKFDNKKITYRLYADELKDDRLPWLNPEALRMAGGKPGKHYRYQLYLGMFDKSIIKPMAESYFRGPQDEKEYIEWQEREELEGSTCYASLAVESSGIPQIGDISLSTLPWAIAHLITRRLHELTYVSYESSVARLNEAFLRIFPYLASDSNQKTVPLTGDALQLLLQALYAWAEFAPAEDELVLAIQLFEVRPGKNISSDEIIEEVAESNLLPDKSAMLPKVLDDEEDVTPSDSTTINILNSFFIQDIEFAIASLRRGDKPEALLRYLTGLKENRHDLYGNEGEYDIIHRLKPTCCNHGRWPASDEHLMSLMQQYAINRSFDVLSENGLFSVNGPPGTGKTTMLRDIVADLMVQRARAMSKLKSSGDAFNGKRTITFTNGDTATISLLVPELTGYEILVASANNAAVENISKELPLAKELGEDYRDAAYLKSVANKLLAEHGSDMKVRELALDKMAWGLMSVALGKKANRDNFLARAVFNKSGEGEYKVPDKSAYQTLWDWRSNYTGPTFKLAKDKFKIAYNTFELELKKYNELIHLWENLSETDKIRYCAKETLAFEDAKQQQSQLAIKVEDLRREFKYKNRNLERLQLEIKAHQALKPGWLMFIFRYRKWHTYRKEKREYDQENLIRLRELNKIEGELEFSGEKVASQEMTLTKTITKLEQKQQEYDRLLLNFERLSEHFQSNLSIKSPVCIRDKAVQRASLFQNSILNAVRTKIFISAMELHEAWLAETLQKGGRFGGNLVGVSKLLSGARVTSVDDILPLWQSLFMIVPVVSSTFSSIARQFKGIGVNDFGWLFVDEAGQAVPQQAVGAMLRCKRVVVVGDPLQIEPVFTTPFALVEGLAKMDFGDDFARWSPSVTSAQRLADEANMYGTYLTVAESPQWVGSPLRVHRRCNDPMFAISNRIAYENTMVHALDDPNDQHDHLLGQSGWLHVTGQVEGRQFVKEQAALVCKIIEHAVMATGSLPNIYIITPFREVRDRLKTLLKSNINFQLYGEQRWKYERWVNERVGTVHAFQGKEEEVVILVLGADQVHSGSANWAASKPNLLNVAVTRAKRRLYIIGDKRLWGRLPYFNEAAKRLESLRIEDIVAESEFII